MNSFNHYAYGAIGEWLYSTVAGISELDPGFKRILLKPALDERLSHASAALDTPYGLVESAWRHTGRRVEWKVRNPPNTSALIVLPEGALTSLKIDSRPWTRGGSHRNLVEIPEGFVMKAGRHRFDFKQARR